MTFFEMFDAAKAGFSKAEPNGLKDHVAVQIEVTEDGSGIFYVETADGVLNVQPYDYRDNIAAVTLPHSTLFSLLKRETTLPEAVASGQAFVAGCMETAAKLFAAIPAPVVAKVVAEPVVAEPVKATETTKTAAAAPVVEAAKPAASTAKKSTTTKTTTTKRTTRRKTK
jgi:hypothetical protein